MNKHIPNKSRYTGLNASLWHQEQSQVSSYVVSSGSILCVACWYVTLALSHGSQSFPDPNGTERSWCFVLTKDMVVTCLAVYCFWLKSPLCSLFAFVLLEILYKHKNLRVHLYRIGFTDKSYCSSMSQWWKGDAVKWTLELPQFWVLMNHGRSYARTSISTVIIWISYSILHSYCIILWVYASSWKPRLFDRLLR